MCYSLKKNSFFCPFFPSIVDDDDGEGGGAGTNKSKKTKMKGQRSLCIVSFSNYDLGHLVNGWPDNSIEDRPFDFHF